MGRKLNLEYRAALAERRYLPRCTVCFQRNRRGTHDGCYRDAQHGERIGTTFRRLRALRRNGESYFWEGLDETLHELGYVTIAVNDLPWPTGKTRWTTITEAGLKALKAVSA